MATEEMFTSLPVVGSSQMSDIICAVQGYISPSVLGLSVQETLQQVYNLFQANIILFYAGNPNGNLAGTTYQFCWDTVDSILYLCTTSGTASTAVWKAVSNNPSGFKWSVITGTTQTIVPNNGYITNNAALVTLTLPATSSVGDRIDVIGQGAGGWKIQCGGGQTIIVGNSSTSAGGYAASNSPQDSFYIICTVANTQWTVGSAPQSSGLTLL